MSQIVEEPPIAVPPSLKRFLWDIQSMVELTDSEREILLIGRDLMGRLVADGDWLPASYAVPDAKARRQFRLYADGLERFTVAVTILAPGQNLPAILDPAWEIVGGLRGAVTLARLREAADGQWASPGEPALLKQGVVATFPSAGRDALAFGNMSATDPAILVHVHGAEMTKVDRRTFADGTIVAAPVVFANRADSPPYDIFSIQTRIED